MKFDVKELLSAGSRKWEEKDVDDVTLRNLEDLCLKLNKLGFKPARYATSCLRSLADQKRINPKAMGSSHLYGAAVDVGDSDGLLHKWLKTKEGKDAIEKCGLWVEDLKSTPTWTHFQIYSPKSGNRFFLP